MEWYQGFHTEGFAISIIPKGNAAKHKHSIAPVFPSSQIPKETAPPSIIKTPDSEKLFITQV